MSRIHLIAVIPTLNGGTGKDFVQKAVQMDPGAVEVTIYAYEAPGEFATYADDVEHVDVISAHTTSLLTAIRRGRTLVAKHDPDVVHSLLFKGYLVGIGMTFARPPAFVYGAQNNEDNWETLKRTVHRSINDRCDQLICISPAVRDDFIEAAGVDEARTTIIPNSGDFERIAVEGAPTSDNPVVGTVARLHPYKGLDTLVEAVAEVSNAYPDIECRIFGDDRGEQAALESQAATLGVESNVRFEGWTKDPYQQIAAMDVFVLPSISEGFGMVVMEALAVGTPVVASQTGGIPEIVDHGETGWLAEPGDVDAFRDRIEWCLDNPAAAAEMGEEGSQRVKERFNAGRLAEKHVQLYQSVLKQER
jgi:glycosyltransferase involved in cell wall biosynthesis